jgi:DNA-binding NarL/FixJ family response regulator
MDNKIEQKLDSLIELTQRLVALELLRSGVPRAQIAKHLHVANKQISNMFKGIPKEK